MTPRPTRRFRFVARLVILIFALLRWRIGADGVDRIPREGGAVVSWNHTSHVDFLVTAWVIYRRTGRPVRFLALRELWDSKLLGWVPRLVDAVPVARRSTVGRADALQEAVRALEEGHLVMVAPEGTISRSFELLSFRTGAARMAQLAGVPLVPSASWGSHRLVTTGHRVDLRSGYRIPVEVRFGEPLLIGADDDVRTVTGMLRERTRQLLHEAQAVYPDGAPPGAWWVPARLGGGAPPPEDAEP